jgi:hypothetical protein
MARYISVSEWFLDVIFQSPYWLFVLAILILFEQKVTFEVWFQTNDLHHETFVLAPIALGFLIGSAITESHEKR